MNEDVDVTQLPKPLTMEEIEKQLTEMKPPTPIGKARFDVARRVVEKSKPAIIRDNVALIQQMSNMRQLLAALLLEREQFTDLPATFAIDDLECINPQMVELQMTGTHATLSLKEIDESKEPDPDKVA